MSPRATRTSVGQAPRVVVKVGSSSLTKPGGGVDIERVTDLVDVIADRVAAGSQVILVSSGAIATGFPMLGLTKRPRDLATQQASASVGQGVLLAQYSLSFAAREITVGQVLLTADDMTRRTHYRNAQRTLDRLLEMGVVPIVNENDTVATDEIRLGDNDRLAALVAHLVRAVDHMRRAGLAWIAPRPEAQAADHAAVQACMRGTVWVTGGCHSWYLDARGENHTLWPDFTFRFRRRVAGWHADHYEGGAAHG